MQKSEDNLLTVSVITLDTVVEQFQCATLILPGSNGEIGIMHNHENMIAHLGNGKISALNEDNTLKVEYQIMSTEGVVHVQNNHCTVIVDKIA